MRGAKDFPGPVPGCLGEGACVGGLLLKGIALLGGVSDSIGSRTRAEQA